MPGFKRLTFAITQCPGNGCTFIAQRAKPGAERCDALRLMPVKRMADVFKLFDQR